MTRITTPSGIPARDPQIQAFVDKALGLLKKKWWHGLYTPVGHLCATVGIPGSATGFALWKVATMGSGFAPLADAAFSLAMVGVANVFEWWAHKYVLHERLPGPFAVMYDEHTKMHHRIYRWFDMAARSLDEWRFILIPARGVLGVIIVSAGVSALVGLLLGPHHGWLALATFSFYVLSYELLHLLYHQSWCPAWIKEHHARHHDTTLMRKYNLNVTIPFADWLFGTIVPKALLDKRRAELAAKSEPWSEDA